MSKPRTKLTYLNVNKADLKKSENKYSTKELETMMKHILSNRIHGISFSPYLDGQDPAEFSQITDVQIADRLSVVEPYSNWVRTFSCTSGNEVIPRIAKEKKFNTCVGVWIGEDKELNEIEIQNAIKIAQEGHADILAVGNEVLLRKDLEVEELIEYIQRVKAAVPHVQVGYVDAYYEFANYPEIVEAIDVVLANCYPFWEHTSIDIAVEYMKKMYDLAVEHSQGKKVIISETGWPTRGEQYGGALPSYENAMRYFIETQNWAKEDNVDILYFSSFDEIWKISREGEYGAYWGLWDKDGNYKFNKSEEE
jgi:exo-beta-1,3-glucanase (GH17 family)